MSFQKPLTPGSIPGSMVLLIKRGGHMPITTFNSFTDGLEPNRRNREHFITNTNLDDDRLWVPYVSGVWFQPCCFNVTSGGFSVVLKGLLGPWSELITILATCMAIQ